ncbi:MAG TPA: tannase/feruloyl esterase family alpha/beta hydrolase, partial [Luteolibacter sp.]|nr:tannase/feruloyl esterase family alpha/beta hydrolase [Luteolibacter sp.]
AWALSFSQADALEALKRLPIGKGTLQVESLAEPGMKLPDGKVIEGLPSRTVVKALLQPAEGSNIRVEIWLPEPTRWNGRFVGLGNGGSAGSIHPGGLAAHCRNGYAVATTDMGTAPNSDSGIGNPEVWKDFGYRATHLMTVLAKEAVRTYYGKAPEFSYFSGRSTGGQQALQEAQRYPEDYDGIIAGVPAHCRTPLHAYFLWNEQILAKCPFTESQMKSVTAAGNQFMADKEVPAAAGKFVSDPRCTPADIEAVIAIARKNDPTLTDKHAVALRELFDGPKHAETGERIFNGVPFGASPAGSHGHLYLFRWVFGAEKNLADINFGKDIDTYTSTLGPYLNAENPDLTPFEKRGGKLLVFSGTADEVVPFHATLDYYDRVIAHFGGEEKVAAFSRFYLIPGMSHGGGPGMTQLPDMLTVIRDWREKGIAPEAIQVHGTPGGSKSISMPVYPYPRKTTWDTTAIKYQSEPGPRGGVERIAERFRPAAKE